MTASELFEAGRLDEAIEALGVALRSDPTDARRRVFLFELLCFAGQYDRAEKQLDVLARLSQDAVMGALLYRSALHAERTRHAMFDSGLPPSTVTPRAVRGTLNGEAFESLMDADPRIGPRLEVFAAGQYTWLPLEHVASVQMAPPRRLRDLIWAPAIVRPAESFRELELGELLLPVLTPEASGDPDPAVRLGRVTDWIELADGRACPIGQKLLLVDGREVPILELRELQHHRRSILMRSVEELLAPIPGGNPAGENLEYDIVYDHIKQARYQDPVNPELKSADWARVIELCEAALAERSKDLQIAVWLTEALVHRAGFAGFRQGLTLLAGLLENYWENVYPPIEGESDFELRFAPLLWLEDVSDQREQHFVPTLRQVPLNQRGHDFGAYTQSRNIPTEEAAAADESKRDRRDAAAAEVALLPEEFDKGFAETGKPFYKSLVADINGCLEVLDTLRAIGDAKAGNVAPSYRPVRTFLEEVRQVSDALLRRKLESDPDPVEPDPPPADPLADENAAPAGGGSDGATVSVVPRSWEEAGSRLAELARFLRAERPTDPASYLMIRGFRWGELRRSGEEPDPRLLAAPPTDIRTRLKSLMLDGRWEELLESAERIMVTPYGRAWLDLQRYVLAACDALGGEYVPVGAAIRAELRSLLQDIPSLPRLSLMDDSPAANSETRDWLTQQGLVPGGDTGEEEAAPKRKTGGLDERLVAQLAKSQPARAVDMLMRAAEQERSERSRFLRRAQASRIMVEAGLEQVAMPILQEMVEQIDRHGLDDWEAGDTVAEPLGLLYRCMERMDGDAEVRRGLYLRVCRLDPLQALAFERVQASDDGEG